MPSLTARRAAAKALAMERESPAADAAEAAAEPEQKESWWETIRFLLILFVITVFVRTFVFAPFSIPSGSMLPNLMIGDYLFVTKWPYGWSRFSMPFGMGGFDGRITGALPDRGDIVVFRYPGPEQEDYVKRVIGLPGDRIEVRGGVVILNGAPVQRQRIADYVMPVSANSPCQVVGNAPEAGPQESENGPECHYPRYRETLPGGRSYDVLDQGGVPADEFGPIVVPEGHVFVMGDNRDDSSDSRVPVEEGGVGLLPVDYLIGEALIAFWSTDGSAGWWPWTWVSAARWERIGRTY